MVDLITLEQKVIFFFLLPWMTLDCLFPVSSILLCYATSLKAVSLPSGPPLWSMAL